MLLRTKAERYTLCGRQDVVEVTPYTFKDASCETLSEHKNKLDSAVLIISMGDIFLKVANDVNLELLAFALST